MVLSVRCRHVNITIYIYINALKRIFVVENLPAWSPNLRLKTAIRKTDKCHFVDPSIAIAALGIGPDDRMKPPSFLMILTATGYAYQREDGVYIAPIGCLKN